MTTGAVQQPSSWSTLPNPAAELKRVDEVLRNVTVARHVLQEFRPITESLGWRLSDLVWASAGVTPFVENEVPFIVTSNGRLSEDAAAVLFANCQEAPPTGPVVVLELGAGSGLFARYFVDAFRDLAARAGSDLGDRLVYLVSDRSRRTVEQWLERGLFQSADGRVIAGVCDAMTPRDFEPVGAGRVPDAPVRTVICNYSIDVLPASLVRQGPDGLEELAIRTSLMDDPALLAQYTRLSPSDIREIAASDDASKLSALLPLVSLLQMEAAFVPARATLYEDAEDALSLVPQNAPRAIVNHGAVASLEASLGLVSTDGFVLVSDYGPVRSEQVAENALVQRFGRTTALGINFPYVDRRLARSGYSVVGPERDEEWPIHSRLFSRRELPGTSAAFRGCFAIEAYAAREKMIEEARTHRAAGRNDRALASYRVALAQRTRDWYLLGEVAEYVGLQLRDFTSGSELARVAVALNPCYSTWLWNVLGDCLFCLGRYEEAHQAYLEAQRIDARDARTNLNLAYTLFQFGSYDEALGAIAIGLAADIKGQYHDSLLQKQQQVVAAITTRAVSEAERMARAIPIPS